MAQDMLAKVRSLIENADSFEEQGNSEAAASYRAKAEELMKKYRIEEEELLAKDPASLSPILDSIVLLSGLENPFQQQYVNLFYVISKHVGIRAHYTMECGREGWEVLAKVVGYESDVRYAEVLYTSARMVFSEKLEPKVNPGLSDQVNAYRLRSAGMERVRVAQALWNNTDKLFLSRVGRLYKAECKARGETPALDGRGVTGKVYREQYAEEFVWSLQSRLSMAQDSAGRFGGGLVLHGRQERVDEAFYTHFPNYRPKPEIERAEQSECEACAKAKKRKGDENAKCRDHTYRGPSRKEIARYERYNSPAAQRGREAGQNAARHVQIDRAGRDGIGS